MAPLLITFYQAAAHSQLAGAKVSFAASFRRHASFARFAMTHFMRFTYIYVRGADYFEYR
jgi:hypothetical protein